MPSTSTDTKSATATRTYKFSGKVLEFDLSGKGKPRKYIMGAIRYGSLKDYVASEIFDATTGQGEQRQTKKARVNYLKKEMVSPRYAPTSFYLGTRDDHRKSLKIENGVATLEVSTENKLALLDGGHRENALDSLLEEGGAIGQLTENTHIPYILYLDGDTQEDFIVLQNHLPVSRDHMLSTRIATGLIDSKHAPYFRIAKDTAQILHEDADSFCHNLIQSDSSGVKLPLSLNSLCGKGASDLAFSLYGGAKIAVNHGKDAKWLAKCILTAYRTIKSDDDCKELLEKGRILSPVPVGTKAGTSLIIGVGNMLAARLMLKQENEHNVSDLDLMVGFVFEHLNVKTSGNTSADSKRRLFSNFVKDFFYDLVSHDTDVDTELSDDDLDIPAKMFGQHEGVPVPLIRLLSPSTFNVSKIPTEPRKRGRKKKTETLVTVIKNNEIEIKPESAGFVDVQVETSKVDSEDPIDAAAFAEDDKKSQVENNVISCIEMAPWEDNDDEDSF